MATMITAQRDLKILDLDELLNQLSVSLRDHSRRVAVCSAIIAEYANGLINIYDLPAGTNLPVIAHLGGTCHDIGKLMLPALEVGHSDYMKHPVLGAELLEKHKDELFGNEPFAQMVLNIVRYHHEQTDGSGFPEGLKSRDIPLIAGICSIANRLDHYLYSENIPAGDVFKVFNILEAQVGKQFCECAWICFERAWPRLIDKYTAWTNLLTQYDQ